MERSELKKYFVTTKEQKKRIKEADNALPQDVKNLYPIESLKEIRERYKSKWVAFLTADVSEGAFPIAGRVVAVSDIRPDLEDVRDQFWASLRRHPSIINTEWLENHPLAK